MVIRLPGKIDGSLDQDQEWCEVEVDGRSRRLRFHDYAEIYNIPSAYEKLFYDELKCTSPGVVRDLLEQALVTTGYDASSLRVIDVGAGNGLVGAEMRALGASTVVGADIIPEAAEAALRDRPEVYDDYLVVDLTDLSDADRDRMRQHDFNCLTCVAALGFGDMPPEAFLEAVHYVSPSGWLAFCIKERFLGDEDESGFAGLVRRLMDEGTLEVIAQQRYIHRLDMRGRPLYYEAVVARRAHGSEDLL
ncbi:MAG TPA: methyltransferase domain-containing protein [Frankiaceae bacterium]|nr:methyltransferase domain-containing protein [Frankiaceae bacterium]